MLRDGKAGSFLAGRAGGWLIAAVALLCALSLAVASLRHTGSLAFPIDDGYIYSNYVASAAQGQFFTYNPGETSGGITGFGWYLLCLVAYMLLVPLHSVLDGFAPTIVSDNGELAAQAGHLFLAAYIPGALCLAATGLGTWKLADLALPNVEGKSLAKATVCWVLGVVAASDLGLAWGAMSGLEVPLSAALVVWTLYLLLLDWRRGRPGWSLLLGAGLSWARPDLLAFAGVALAWLLLRFLFARDGREHRKAGIFAVFYLLACAAGAGLLSLTYLLGWGRPLPSSFYAKVGGLRLFDGFGSAAEELLLAGRLLPFVVAGLALLGGLVWFVRPASRDEQSETRWTALFLMMSFSGFVLALMLIQPWFGQEDRYILPVHPCAIVLVGMLMWFFIRAIPLERFLARPLVLSSLAGAIAVLVVLNNYVWATRNHVVYVRNITDAHVAPARWMARNTPPEALIASEPIGAVRLFSERRTFDVVGLTSPTALGSYGPWETMSASMRAAGADYLLIYPAWFEDGRPEWALERMRFPVEDNRIAGEDLIAIYELSWGAATMP
ncbi:MAG: hypothetical protein M3437_04585 [Chloroflexota bacterium]|nr:hypothetical protein [Chloroflexota bacterium]MDQ5866244.1 hypothetical protein [Chloroflexota bacterium]